ncbi:MAG: hypothetical protein ABII25_03875, partial [bacterium]
VIPSGSEESVVGATRCGRPHERGQPHRAAPTGERFFPSVEMTIRNKMPKKKKFPFYIIFITLLILLTSIIIVNIYLDKVVSKHILPPLEKYLDKEIEFSGISMGLCGIKISGVNIKDENNSKVFACDKMYIYFLLKPLLNKEFIIDHIRFVKPRTTIYHQADGKWVSIYEEKEKGEESKKEKIKIELKKIFIEKVRLK